MAPADVMIVKRGIRPFSYLLSVNSYLRRCAARTCTWISNDRTSFSPPQDSSFPLPDSETLSTTGQAT